jgi:ParB/RepB/Spo0J family partition protein
MSTSKRGLGRGLGALIPGAPAPQSPDGAARPEGGVLQAPIDTIVPNPRQPRMAMAEDDLAELAASIQEHGIIQPLIVMRAGDGFQLIAGERRWRAAQRAGLTTVPVIVKDVSSQELLELALVENVQRADLNALEEALAYRQLMDDFGLTQEQVARRVGKSRGRPTPCVCWHWPTWLSGADPGHDHRGPRRALLGLSKHEPQIAALQTCSRAITCATPRNLRRAGERAVRAEPTVTPSTARSRSA